MNILTKITQFVDLKSVLIAAEDNGMQPTLCSALGNI